jgi:hypothetical protein
MINLAIELGGGYSELGVYYPFKGAASGLVTEIRLLVVMVQQRVLRAVMLSEYVIRHAGSGLSRGILCIRVSGIKKSWYFLTPKSTGRLQLVMF